MSSETSFATGLEATSGVVNVMRAFPVEESTSSQAAQLFGEQLSHSSSNGAEKDFQTITFHVGGKHPLPLWLPQAYLLETASALVFTKSLILLKALLKTLVPRVLLYFSCWNSFNREKVAFAESKSVKLNA